jgi:triacylglycerol lipase
VCHSGLEAPIVLVHGVLGFDRVRVGGREWIRYFPGIEEKLRESGNKVRTAKVHPTHTVATRAAQLVDFLDREFPKQPVHLIGHSMGGLDARYAISRLTPRGRVLTLTTVGTPHQGSPFADWLRKYFGRGLERIARYLGIPMGALDDLTTTAGKRWNEIAPDISGVAYLSIAGLCETNQLPLAWRIPAQVVTPIEGKNDGIVSLTSAQHGELWEVWQADHMNLVNRKNTWAKFPTDRTGDYLRWVQKLKSMGY